MPKLVTLTDRESGEKLVRNAVDAREILESDKDGRFSGKVAKRQAEAPEGPPVIEQAAPVAAVAPKKAIKSKNTKGK